MDLGVFSLSILASVIAAFMVAGFKFVPTLFKKTLKKGIYSVWVNIPDLFAASAIDYEIFPRQLLFSPATKKKCLRAKNELAFRKSLGNMLATCG